MNMDLAKAALTEQQEAFNVTVKQPNTLERNVVLAGHRAEIARLQKTIDKAAQQAIKTGAARRASVAAASLA